MLSTDCCVNSSVFCTLVCSHWPHRPDSVRSISIIEIALLHRFPCSVLNHTVEVDSVTVGEYIFIVLVINVSLRLDLLVPLCFVAWYTAAVRIFPSHAIGIHVAVLSSCNTVDTYCFLFVRAIVVFESPSYAAIRVVFTITSQHL